MMTTVYTVHSYREGRALTSYNTTLANIIILTRRDLRYAMVIFYYYL